MNIRDFSKPMTAQVLNEGMAKKFGTKLAVDKFTTEELYDARNKIRTRLSQIQTTESYDSVQGDKYQKNKMFLDVINAELDQRAEMSENSIAESRRLSEAYVSNNPEEVAELVMASRDMVDRLTGWMEDTSEMETDSMLDLADSIRSTLGEKMADSFTTQVRPALQSLYSSMEEARKVLNNSVDLLSGTVEPREDLGDDEPLDGLGSEEPDMALDAEGEDDLDLDLDLDDEFGAADVAAGGEEEAGREKRESRSYSKKKA